MLVPCLGVWPLVHVLDFKPVHMCWEQLPVGEWADCALIVVHADTMREARARARRTEEEAKRERLTKMLFGFSFS